MLKLKSISAVTLLLLLSAGLPAHSASISAEDMLGRLAIAPESNSSTYKRTLFKHWVDQDKDSCDTREEVLLQESISPAKRSAGCKITSGKWLSQYEKKTFTKPTGLDIDHMVPLKEAWESGAHSWTATQRQAFANDLGFKGSLIAVSASTNRSKGDKDPSKWLPANKSFVCTYVVTWIQVKYRWSLTIDADEHSAIVNTLGSCPVSKLFELPKQIIAPKQAPQSSSPIVTESSPVETPGTSLDPRFDSCSTAKSEGYGPYVRGDDPEYDWYRDGDGDGIVCE
jgi:hypothetical protein